MTTVLSGIQPTQEPQLGNYLGALRWWVDLQHGNDAYYFVVDLHALTVPRDPAELRSSTTTMATMLLALGLDPDTCTLFVQSHVPAHAQLAWLLECTASYGEMNRMTQWKDKSAKGGADASRFGLLAYPALQAADILLYRTDRVPVGEDQRQHLELARNLAERFNARYGETFVVPDAVIPPRSGGARIMDLQEPTKKMSKSAENTMGTLFLLDDPATITRKIRRAVTDTETGPGSVRYDPERKPGVSNLLDLLAICTGKTPAEVASGYRQYGPLKADTADAVIELLAPIQARYHDLASDPGAVAKVLAAGAEHAREVAAPTLAAAYEAIGLMAP
ncbi:MAG: tryptophan--tRNA ligase, partial [Acidimicrobiaceae bacterium]|nr:tryptophan--tRNA ligase [Acidimicrobiaceae bacterium]